jgi:hypothetical protein
MPHLQPEGRSTSMRPDFPMAGARNITPALQTCSRLSFNALSLSGLPFQL